MILLKVFGGASDEILEGINFLDVYTLSFVTFLFVAVFMVTKLRSGNHITEHVNNKDILGQERTVANSVNERMPFSNFSNKRAYVALCIFMIFLVTLLYLFS